MYFNDFSAPYLYFITKTTNKNKSLVATIKHFRPDLLVDNESQTEPIPKEMPLEHSLQNLEQIEDIGQPTTACFLAISNVNPVGW